MSLADALASRLAPTEAVCPVPGLLLSLPPEDADALRRAMEPGVIDANPLAKLLRANGHPISTDALRAHKTAVARARGEHRNTLPCSCPSETL